MTDFILADRTELLDSVRTEFAALQVALRTAYEDALGRLDRLEALLTTREGYASLPKPKTARGGGGGGSCSNVSPSETEKRKPISREERKKLCEGIAALLQEIIATDRNTDGGLEFEGITVEVWEGKENVRVYLHPSNEYVYIDEWERFWTVGTSPRFRSLVSRLEKEKEPRATERGKEGGEKK